MVESEQRVGGGGDLRTSRLDGLLEDGAQGDQQGAGGVRVEDQGADAVPEPVGMNLDMRDLSGPQAFGDDGGEGDGLLAVAPREDEGCDGRGGVALSNDGGDPRFAEVFVDDDATGADRAERGLCCLQFGGPGCSPRDASTAEDQREHEPCREDASGDRNGSKGRHHEQRGRPKVRRSAMTRHFSAADREACGRTVVRAW